ncbi:glycosyltransferase involved in cell wall biosynthesis [Phyllobacterium trifolii]|uniref:Glycosyltransferase involved in cell wall biosynthesis n=1 Tax=Phyllobacterium trifolii TaxID=300193 RepID=A0A839UFY2_9HYPH|nr:glycosyltransferase [Phyllobacterium trifolii]MBB3149946.1 glycosyltransferase involved in cell wall biosynthesis [Phyllobacterium trifolii]
MIYADITEFVSNPIGTGIQRTVREIFTHWPGGLPACYFDGNALRTMAPDALAAVLDNSSETASREKAAIAAQIIAANPGTVLGSDAYILIPELFWDIPRCNFYAARVADQPARTFAIVYDLLPWTHQDQFGIVDMSPHEPYFRFIFSMAYTAHISTETRQSYEMCTGSKKPWDLPVLHLGADGINMERQHFSPSRKTFVCVGSIEARKRQNDILRAFKRLWDEGVDAELVFVGRVLQHANRSLADAVKDASARYPQFKHYEHATDDDLIAILSTARATIMASTLEGYGIPPIESLHIGIPVIVSETMPSTRRLPNLGQIRFEPKQPSQIAAAVMTMLDDTEASRLWDEAAVIKLPMWRDTAMQVREWATNIWLAHRPIDAKLAERRDKSAALWLSEIGT